MNSGVYLLAKTAFFNDVTVMSSLHSVVQELVGLFNNFCRAMLRKRGLNRYAVSVCVCVCVCVSVTFVDHVKTNKNIFKIFSPSGSHTILVFPCQTA